MDRKDNAEGSVMVSSSGQEADSRRADIGNELRLAAAAAQKNAYAPYSKFQVGAAILAENGRIYVGANVENASYPQGQCAESSAIGAMIADGARSIMDIVIVGPTPCTPCGGCRQRIAEFATGDTLVHSATAESITASWRIDELLPAGFTLKPLA